MKVLICRFCLIVLQKISICHRSLAYYAIVVAPALIWLPNRNHLFVVFIPNLNPSKESGKIVVS